MDTKNLQITKLIASILLLPAFLNDDKFFARAEEFFVTPSFLRNESSPESQGRNLKHSSDPVCVDKTGWSIHNPNDLWDGVTCADISQKWDFWCGYLSSYTSIDNFNSIDACCTCNGGSEIVDGSNFIHPSAAPSSSPTECRDEPGWLWDQENNYGCEKMTESFCDDLAHVYFLRKNVISACCACGGGSHILPPPTVAPSSEPSTLASSKPSSEPSLDLSQGPSQSPTGIYHKCKDELDWSTYDEDGFWSGKTCTDISELPSFWCEYLAQYERSGFNSIDACCVCGGGTRDDPTPPLRPGATASPSAVPSPIPSISSSEAPSQCVDEPGWYWDEEMNYSCEENSPSFCDTLSSIWNKGKNVLLACCVCGGGQHVPYVPSTEPSAEPSLSHVPTSSSAPTVQFSSSPSSRPSSEPSVPPTFIPSGLPSIAPSTKPSEYPSDAPSSKPSVSPSAIPSANPTLRCYDFPANWFDEEGDKFNCLWYADKENCEHYGNDYENFGKTAKQACCVCGGGVTNASPSNPPSL